MKCSEFETMIAPYVEGKAMSTEDTLEFLEHLKECQSCYEELETHYIVYQVSKQLDDADTNDTLEVSDFKKMLENQIKTTQNSIRHSHSGIMVKVLFALLLVLIVSGIVIVNL
ncbi:MAG: zf-HC2 domain-containing protein [Eubacteriales bacterium]|nr:zf-HC2 domain-containing protein [Eubacteriales bacterium]